ALPDPDRGQSFREPEDLLGQLAPVEGEPRSVFAQPDGGLLLGQLAGRPPVDAVPGQVELPADEPRRPLDSAGGVEDTLPWRRELEPQVLDHGRPEALGMLDRDAV